MEKLGLDPSGGISKEAFVREFNNIEETKLKRNRATLDGSDDEERDKGDPNGRTKDKKTARPNPAPKPTGAGTPAKTTKEAGGSF